MSIRPMRCTAAVPVLVPLLVLSVLFLAACGGGSQSPSGTAAGPAVVDLSLASAPAFPEGTALSPSPATAEAMAPPSAPAFDNVFATIVKVALVPGGGTGGPDPDGEVPAPDGAAAGGLVSFDLPEPVEVDLLHLPPPESVAGLLASIPNVPPGSYGKIRLYYSGLEGVRGGSAIPFHPTANAHFDVHFVDGALVVPVPAGSGGAVTFFAVQIRFVGLKIVENNAKVLMRPQAFAVVEDLLFRVEGTAQNVDKAAQRFDIVPSEGAPVPAVYDGATGWAFRDGTTQVEVASSLGVAAIGDGAFVAAVGSFGAGGVLAAERVSITFPAVVTGVVVSGTPASGWLPDNTFVVLPPGSVDNVIVFPRPARADARYDNTADPAMTFSDNAVVNGVDVTARGYAVAGGIDAFWVSVGP